MIKIYEDIKEFIGNNAGIGDIEYKFSKNCYLLKVYDETCELIVEKGIDSELFVTGSVSLMGELVENMIQLGLCFETYVMTMELSEAFNKKYVVSANERCYMLLIKSEHKNKIEEFKNSLKEIAKVFE